MQGTAEICQVYTCSDRHHPPAQVVPQVHCWHAMLDQWTVMAAGPTAPRNGAALQAQGQLQLRGAASPACLTQQCAPETMSTLQRQLTVVLSTPSLLPPAIRIQHHKLSR